MHPQSTSDAQDRGASPVKICSRCGETKTLSAFYVRRGASDGRRGCCKACQHKPAQLWRPYTAQEDQYIREHFLTCTAAEMAAHLGRAEDGVQNRQYRLGLKGKWAPWPEDDVAALRAYYAEHAGRPLQLRDLAQRLGRSVVALSLKARDLGLADSARARFRPPSWTAAEDDVLRANRARTNTDIAQLLGRSPSVIARRRRALGLCRTPEEIAAGMAERWQIYPHPRGMLGRKHSPATLAKLSAAHVATWVRAKETGTGLMSEKLRQDRSDRMLMRQATDPRLRRGFSKGTGGTRTDLGIYVRSRWEANIARYLEWLRQRGEIYSWAYESTTFWFEHIKRGTRSYTPDFEIVEREGDEPHFWEIKGWHHPRGQTALARMARYYPQVRITVIDEPAYKAIARWKALIPGWEAGNGSHKD